MQHPMYSVYSRVANKMRRAAAKGTMAAQGHEWLRLIGHVNRCYLVGPAMHHISLQPDGKRLGTLDILAKLSLSRAPERYRYLWPIALNALGAEWHHRLHGCSEDLSALARMFDQQIDLDGEWLTPINTVDCAMKGYSLLYIAELTGEQRYQSATHKLVKSLLDDFPRSIDGSLVYSPTSDMVLVDTLGMISPFLARYARHFDHPRALSVGLNQLRQFIQTNVDCDSHLPYHGYRSGEVRCLGLHGWGRGAGWYMLGLVDTLAEMSPKHPDYDLLCNSMWLTAQTLRTYQRPDGHWNWAILHHDDAFDSSTTAMVGYSLVRAMQLGLLDELFQETARAAIDALIGVTDIDGQVNGGLGECLGLGKYPQVYGRQQWLQGASVAFASVFLGDNKTRGGATDTNSEAR